ncbi:FliH/SctL family protein [Desulfobulbus elongatus]|uniref:FliH/SctL family protein n=1 Tax=Desulfobulbus elongatus TaxID=53332 RepID=UPI0012F89908|nr:FliH/SctL family protein [Desulfobulbus elongatus]
MSSSKVFKQDPLFTPTTLVRRSIPLPRKEEPPAVEEPVADGPGVRDTPVEPEHPPEDRGRHEPEPAPAVDAEAIRQEAYNQGRADLADQFQMDVHQAVAAFAESCQKLDGQRTTMFRHNRAELINLVVLISEKILRRELATPRNVIAATLEAALEQAIESEEYYVTLHPDDLAVAEARVPELIAAIRGLAHLVFKTDEGMTRGGCLLESAVCTVDASIETQLDSMKELLEEQPFFVPAPGSDFAAAPEPPDGEPPPEA